MQRAEGPEAFEHGYFRMRRLYRDNAAKLQYIDELYNDVKKAHFKGELPFCNGVLVDVCETFFNALKSWVNGRCKNKRVTLLMAFVRICQGVYRMATRDFLGRVSDAAKDTKSSNPLVSFMFRIFRSKLTSRAVKDMYDSLERRWGGYDVTSLMNESIQLISHAGDCFRVAEDFTCKCQLSNGWTTCWQQSHTGLLCNHALRACVHLLQQAEREDREDIVNKAVQVCDKNWLRATFRSVTAPTNLPRPVQLTSSAVHNRTKNNRWSQYLLRFREVIHFLSPDAVERHLFAMETLALSEGVNSSENSDGTVSDDSSSVFSTSTSNTHPSSVSSDTRASSVSSTRSLRNVGRRTSSNTHASSVSVPSMIVSNPAKRRRNRNRYISIVPNV